METIAPESEFNKIIENGDENKLTPMRLFFKDKSVFLTGGLGFLGQLYVEKLLRCDVKHIYLLGRPKKGKSTEERLKNTFTGSHFMKLYNHDPHYLKRVSIIEGDMGSLNMGISESDEKELIENVQIVIHAAADVRFDEKLKTLLMINLRGTREILELTMKMKQIQVFTFISTAFSHCVRTYIEEKFYDSPLDPDIMIRLGEQLNDKSTKDLEVLTERIIKPWPNTYTYTKSLTEELVRHYGNKFPICIMRPSIVISTHEDPVPAWCNNIYGLNGILVACGLGVLRLLPIKENNVGDVVCADFVINSTLAALWATHEEHEQAKASKVKVEKDPEIYNVCTSTDRPVTWGTIAESMGNLFRQYPAKRVLWKHCHNIVNNQFMFTYLTIWYHVIPGLITDLALKIGKKDLRVMPIYRKVQRFMVALSFFMKVDWRFDTTNMKRVIQKMTPEDREFFPSDVRRYSWSTFLYNYLSGLKVYIGLESLDDGEKAKAKYKRLEMLHYLVLFFYYGIHIFIFTMIALKLGVTTYLKNSLIENYEFLKNPQLEY
ncbi:fatty acyl-CoA reductase wat-like [Episyrphus balteatus]|uniref:fatty acyl-CoA reductase wat-like n=1 Tax=Episyrphus balteatus TaxID=286459 RepID=UPI002485DDC6|nr:fatty acyl-CoA reductase wat-like [Episyrphus balteatus]